MFGVRETINLPAWAEELPDLLPHGSGIDADWVIEGHAHHITCRNSFHCMNDCGMYEGWQDFSVIIKNGRYFQNGTVYKGLNITIHFHGSQYLARKHMLREYLGDTIAGHQIGNFHPIWVNWRGSKITIEELSRTQMTSKIYKIPLIWSMTNTLDVEAASPTVALLGILDEGIPHEDSEYVNYSLKIPLSEFKKLNSLTDEEIESLRKNKSWGSILLED